ncbi:DUF6701 domain-containing protein [Roseateles cellulosilyticus]|uniref:LamG-like jellyroll fold domain-containing protein n=1 Tax=Pelomonas cellulosilytica TaxID=2906762 RepID=A0ABS8Y217_9BURK|nr:DUF6701 domain-containing protein [Pelomonas sp. P8]MCE4555870.1 hypothetical protein [Pelomonas sp. P8]
MMRRLLASFALLLLALPLQAAAAAYSLPGNPPPGCTGSNSSYTCAALTLAYGDTLAVNAPKPATLTINGNLSTDTSQVNTAGAASDLTLVVNGTLTLGYQARITANITATSVNDGGGGSVVITGNLAATGGNVTLGYLTTVSGNLSTTGAGTLTTPQNGSIGGNVSAGSGAIGISQVTSVAGSVTGSGPISVGQGAVVSGNVATSSGTVDLAYQARVNGNVSGPGAITLGQDSVVGGSVTGGAGNVSVGYAASIAGPVTTSTGTIDLAQNAMASACVKSTASAGITLGYQSRANSVCCGGASCSNSCVVNNSTYAMPALCAASAPTLLADYRMDELPAWNGTAAEVKDSSGNGYNGQAATAAAGTPVATTLSGSPAHGTTAAGSCGYGVFNRATPSATHAYVQLPGSFPALSGNFSVVAWVRSSTPAQPHQRVIARDDNQDGWALSLGDAGTPSLRLFNRNVSATGSVTVAGSNGTGATTGNCASGTFCLDSAPVFAADTWYYVAALVDTTGQQVQILVYSAGGTLLASASSAYSGTWRAGTGGTTLGGESASSSEGVQPTFHFNGNIDELQVYNGLLTPAAIASQLARSRSCPAVGSFSVSGTGSASTCTPQTLTIAVRDINGNVLTNYTGTVQLSTSSGRGDWSAGAGPAPAGGLATGAPNSGLASYTFATGDAGVVKLRLAHSLGQNLTVTVVDVAVPASSSTSAVIGYRDNAFVWTEAVPGGFVAVAGRPHGLRVSILKRDPTTGVCGIATDYTGNRAVKLWRTDSGGPWAAPGVVSPALAVIPAARPAANNLTLGFNAGVAGFDLATGDVGKYAFSLDDDSLGGAATTASGTSAELTVRPFTLAITGLTAGSTANPGGSAAKDAIFAKAGAPFSASVTAYRWSSGADSNNDGVPDAGVTLAQVSAGGPTPGFNASVALTPLADSQTPAGSAGGVLGTLGNNVLSGFSNGTATAAGLTYSEVGSFQLNTSAVTGNYLATAGLNLDALVFDAAGQQQPRVGRFIPAGFALSSPSYVHRVDLGCTVASTFTYLGENFRLAFTLTAQNASGGTTQNYAGSFARLDLALPGSFKLAGIAGTTVFKTGNGRLATVRSNGSWRQGVADVKLDASAGRAATPDGPFNADFGIAAVDGDGVGMLAPNLDTDSPADGVDAVRVGTIPLRFGRLRLQNGIAPANRTLALPLDAQYWNATASAFNTNTLDSCTRVSAANLSFGNLRRTLEASDAAMAGPSVTVAQGKSSLLLAAPAAGHVGTLDVAVALDAATPPADASCLKTQTGWTPAKAATGGAGLAALRGAWCGSSATSDPAARATWGLVRGANGVIYQRENY